jgi:ATP-dependent Lon protease
VDDRYTEIDELRKKMVEAKMPQDVQKVTEKELDRLSKMSQMSAEYTVSRTYLDWLVDLPWSRATEDNLVIEDARKTQRRSLRPGEGQEEILEYSRCAS